MKTYWTYKLSNKSRACIRYVTIPRAFFLTHNTVGGPSFAAFAKRGFHSVRLTRL